MGASWRVVEGDALERLRELDAGSVQTCVTSPPYFGLRDYGTGEWSGGVEGCDHSKDARGRRPIEGGNARPGLGVEAMVERGGQQSKSFTEPYGAECGKCGATRTDSQVGLEATPDEYVARMVDVFREVRRTLRDDATLWLNLGDSFGAGKQLLGVPWRVAFALQADGWVLRSDIVWAKPNPMPESVTDRPTKAHELIFLLSKQPRYYFDNDAIREEMADDREDDGYADSNGERNRGGRVDGFTKPHNIDRVGLRARGGRNKRSVWTVATQPFPGAHFAVFPPKLIEPCVLAGSAEDTTVLDPFSGAGTTGLVATRLGRSYIGIELSPTYAAMSRERIRDDAPLMNYILEAP